MAACWRALPPEAALGRQLCRRARSGGDSPGDARRCCWPVLVQRRPGCGSFVLGNRHASGRQPFDVVPLSVRPALNPEPVGVVLLCSLALTRTPVDVASTPGRVKNRSACPAPLFLVVSLPMELGAPRQELPVENPGSGRGLFLLGLVCFKRLRVQSAVPTGRRASLGALALQVEIGVHEQALLGAALGAAAGLVLEGIWLRPAFPSLRAGSPRLRRNRPLESLRSSSTRLMSVDTFAEGC